jgi:transcription elongation factor GreA
MPKAMTEEIKKKLRDELNTLEHELAFDIPRELKKAVALGDLSENAEYHTAKQRQEYLKARVRQLGKRLADLSLINMNNIPKDKVGLGSTVTIFDGTKNEEMEYKFVASEESDVACGQNIDDLADRPSPAEQESWRHRNGRHSRRKPRNGNPEALHHARHRRSQAGSGTGESSERE